MSANTTSSYRQRFSSLLRRIKRQHSADPCEPRDPITELIFGFIQWNAPCRGAEAALHRVEQAIVDHNDLRVSHIHEIVELLGEDYPDALARAARLREALQEIFVRQHTLSLESLAEKSKKDVRAYLESLPGMTPFVAAHVTLVCFDGHAVPVDDRMAELLRSEEVVDSGATVPQITSFLERNIRADDTLTSCAALRAWTDAGTRRASLVRSARGTAPATKTTARKKTVATRARKKTTAGRGTRKSGAGR